MKGKKNSDRKSDVKNKKQVEGEGQQNADDKTSEHDFYQHWKHPDKKNMGNDISSEIKIANSGGEREGGSDKRWHMEDNDEANDRDDRIGK
jgi:hypothetical protein